MERLVSLLAYRRCNARFCPAYACDFFALGITSHLVVAWIRGGGRKIQGERKKNGLSEVWDTLGIRHQRIPQPLLGGLIIYSY
jgi:hypothetical protein